MLLFVFVATSGSVAVSGSAAGPGVGMLSK